VSVTARSHGTAAVYRSAVAVRLMIGVLIGAVAATLGALAALAWDDGRVSATAVPSTTTTAPVAVPPEPDWLEQGGVRYESTVVLAGPLEVADGVARIDFEVATIGQNPVGFGYLQVPSPLPEVWRLTTVGGATVEATTGPPRLAQNYSETPDLPAGTVRFDLPADLGPTDIATVEVTGWRVAVPVEFEVTLDAGAGASYEMFDGTVLTLGRVLEQRDTTILDFDLDTPADPWLRWGRSTSGSLGPISGFRPAGAGWATSGTTTSDGFQLTWGAPTPPSQVTIDVSLVAWVPIGAVRPLVVYEER
jgi:hypothetical protein